MSHRIGSYLGVLVVAGTGVLAAGDVVQLPTQTLTNFPYPAGHVYSRFIGPDLLPTFERWALSPSPPQSTDPLSYAPGDEVIETVTAPAGMRFVVTPGSADTYMELDTGVAHYGSVAGTGATSYPFVFGGLEGTPPQVILHSFVASSGSTGATLQFGGRWSVPAAFSFTSVTFTGIVPQEQPATGATFEDVFANLYVYEPYPPGSTSDQLLSMQPIPEPIGGMALLVAPLLLTRKRRAVTH